MRIFASVTFVALLSTSTVHALADQFEWGPLTSQPRNDQNTIWDANCNDSSEHVVLDNALLPREPDQITKRRRSKCLRLNVKRLPKINVGDRSP